MSNLDGYFRIKKTINIFKKNIFNSFFINFDLSAKYFIEIQF